MASREENDLWFGDPSFAEDDEGGEDFDVCECGHTAVFHVDMSADLGLGRCSHGGCDCTDWKPATSG